MADPAAERSLARIKELGGFYVWDSLMFVVALNDCAVTDDDLALFADLPDVELLTIGNAPVTDRGLQHLQGLKKLTELYLVDTSVTESGITTLRNDLPQAEIYTDWPINRRE